MLTIILLSSLMTTEKIISHLFGSIQERCHAEKVRVGIFIRQRKMI